MWYGDKATTASLSGFRVNTRGWSRLNCRFLSPKTNNGYRAPTHQDFLSEQIRPSSMGEGA